MAGLVAGVNGRRGLPKSVWAERRPNAISELYTSRLNAIASSDCRMNRFRYPIPCLNQLMANGRGVHLRKREAGLADMPSEH